MASRIESLVRPRQQAALARLSRKVEPTQKRNRPQSEFSVLLAYLFDTGQAGRGQATLNCLSSAADARRDFLDRLNEWVEFTAKARAVELLRDFIEHPPQPEPLLRPRLAASALALPEAQRELEPFFRSREEAASILRGHPNRSTRWARYFQKFGCIACGEKKRLHVACGFCNRCYPRIKQRLKRIDRKG